MAGRNSSKKLSQPQENVMALMRSETRMNVVSSEETEQDSLMSKEKINGLHAQLNCEADKIHKWRHTLEMQLKKKDELLQEAKARQKSLRAANLDLQLENENLSGKFQAAQTSLTSAHTWMHGSKQMYEVFKKKMTMLEQKISTCEHRKELLVLEEGAHKDNVEKLSKKFHDLSISADNQKRKLREDREAMEAKYRGLLEQAEKKITGMLGKLHDKDGELKEVTVALQHKEEDIKCLQKTVDILQQREANMEKSLSNAEDKTGKLEHDVKALQRDKETASKSLEETKRLLQETNKDLMAELKTAEMSRTLIQSLRTENEEVSNRLAEEQLRLEETQKKLNEEIQEKNALKSDIEKLTEERTALGMQVESLQRQKDELDTQLETIQHELLEAMDLLHIRETELEAVQNKVDACSEEMKKRDEIHSSLLESQETNKGKITALEEEQSHLQAAVEEHKKQLEATQHQLSNMQSAYEEARKGLEELKEKAALEKSALQEEVKSLKDVVAKKNEELENSKPNEEVDDMKLQICILKDQLETLNKDKTSMTGAIESLKSDLQSKMEEMEATKSRHESEMAKTKEKLAQEEDKVNTAVSNLENKQDRFQAMLKTIAESKKEIEENMSQTINVLKKKIQILEDEAAQKETERKKLLQQLDDAIHSGQKERAASEKLKEQEEKLKHARREICDLKFQVDRLKDESKGYQVQLSVFKNVHQVSTPCKRICRTPLQKSPALTGSFPNRKRRGCFEDQMLVDLENETHVNGKSGTRRSPAPPTATPKVSSKSPGTSWIPGRGVAGIASMQTPRTQRTPKTSLFHASPKKRSQALKTPKPKFFRSPLAQKRLDSKASHDLSWLQNDDVFGFNSD